MEIIYKKKIIEIIEQLGEKSYRVTFKGKTYFMKKFDNRNEFINYIDCSKYLKNCGVLLPKIYFKDKKQLFVLSEFIEGENPLLYLSKGPLDEVYYKSIFNIAFRSKIEGINLNFSPENFKLKNGKLVYLNIQFEKYSEDRNFVNHYVKLWFHTKELVEHLKERNLPIECIKLKEEYETNKELVLATIKYYM